MQYFCGGEAHFLNKGAMLFILIFWCFQDYFQKSADVSQIEHLIWYLLLYRNSSRSEDSIKLDLDLIWIVNWIRIRDSLISSSNTYAFQTKPAYRSFPINCKSNRHWIIIETTLDLAIWRQIRARQNIKGPIGMPRYSAVDEKGNIELNKLKL